jgi:hypothetical protein
MVLVFFPSRHSFPENTGGMSMNALFVGLPLLIIVITLLIWFAGLQAKRADFIRTYSFPAGLADRLGTHYPQLTAPDRQLVEAALRQFFLAYLKGGRKFVSMPSQSAEQAVRAAPSRYSADQAARAAPP